MPLEVPLPVVQPAAPKTPRSIVYIDGFNFYYGAIKGGPYKWLNLEKFFVSLRQHDEVRRIYYFTALVTGSSQARQRTYLKALATLPLVSVVLGKYKTKRVLCTVPACLHTGIKHFLSSEEKRTDVNIAIQLLDDAYQDMCDTFIAVSGDSDLVPGLLAVKQRFPDKQIVVYVPARDRIRGAATELRGAADRHRTVPLSLLRVCQFPARVPDGHGGFIDKPATW